MTTPTTTPITIGIDLGTTNSLVTAYIDNQPVLIPNAYGDLLTPSVVSFADGQVLVGKAAKERLQTHPDSTQATFKTDMGTERTYTLGKKKFTPQELSSFVIRQLVTDAQTYLGQAIDEVIVSVPAYFSTKARMATKQAGQLAGVNVERLVNEPSAAALSVWQPDTDIAFIVFDFGGGTLDVSVVECFDNVINICAIAGDNRLGGHNFDQLIAEDILATHNLSPKSLSPQDKQTLLKTAETAKIALSTADTCDVQVSLGGAQYTYQLTMDKLRQLSTGIFGRMRQTLDRAVRDSGLDIGAVEYCLLVGGSSAMPLIESYLHENLKIPVIADANLDTVVAKGLGIYAGIKARHESVRALVLSDVCPFSLNVNINNDQQPNREYSQVIIPRNTTLPTKKTRSFVTLRPGQTTVQFKINQGEGMYIDENLPLGKMSVRVPYNKTELEEVLVSFYYDINALLIVTVQVVSTGEEHNLLVDSNDKLTASQLEKRKAELLSQTIGFVSEIDLLQTRAQRLFQMAGDDLKPALLATVRELETLRHTNSLKLVKDTLIQLAHYLDQIEHVAHSQTAFAYRNLSLVSDDTTEDEAHE